MGAITAFSVKDKDGVTGPEASNMATKEIRDILSSVGVRNFPELAEKPDLWLEVQNEINNLAVK